jgi:hypothetical protein
MRLTPMLALRLHGNNFKQAEVVVIKGSLSEA